MAQSPSSSHTFPVVDGIDQVAGLSLVLAVLFIVGRLAANLRLHRKLFLDDYAAITGFVFFITYTGLCLGIDQYARYAQSDGTRDATASYFQKTAYAAEVIGPPASLTAKASILLLYLRIFNPSIPLRRGVAALFAITCIIFTPSLPLFSFYCAPNANDSSWDDTIAQNCMKVNSWSAFLQCADVVINVAILLLPMPSVFRLQLSLKRRLLLAFVLMHGVFALAASIAGAVYRANLAKTSDVGTALWFRSAAFVCFEVELGMTLVSGSFHACWGFIRYALVKRASQNTNSRRDYYYRSDDLAEKMPGASETGLSERTDNGRRLRSEFNYADGAQDLHSATTLRHPPAALGTRSLQRVGPALQPGLPLSHHLPESSSSVNVLPITAPSHDSSSSEASSTPTVTRFEDLQYSPAPSEHSERYAPSSDAGDAHPAPSPSPYPCVVHTGGLMAEIEAAVAAAGKALLVVGGRTRPSSGASFGGVDVQCVAPTTELHGAEDATGHREYVVEMVGDEYVVEKAPPRTFLAAGSS